MTASPDRASLLAAYRATTYRIDLPGRSIHLRIGDPAPAFDLWLREGGARCACFITAHNPGSIRLDPAENARRHRAFLDRVTALSLRAVPATAVPDAGDWPPEEGLVILDLGERDGLALAEAFGQNALVQYRIGEAPGLTTTPLLPGCP